MTQRNAPCPCGSGKKYKKCCLSKSEIPIETLVEEALNRTIGGMYEQPITPAINAEYELYQREWLSKLDGFWDEEEIDVAASEYYFFVARRDLWKRYLIKVLNDPVRSAVREIVETWQEPIVLFGKVTEEKNDWVVVEEVLGEGTYYIRKEKDMPVYIGEAVFGVALPDKRIHEKGVLIITSLLFVENDNNSFTNEISKLAEASGFDNSVDFYKANMVDIYHRVLSKSESDATEGSQDRELSDIQLEALDIYYKNLEFLSIQSDQPEKVENIILTYLVEKQPKFKKPEVMAAAFFHTFLELSAFDDYLLSQTEIAKLFKVSVSSMTNQSHKFHEFIVEMDEEVESNQGFLVVYTLFNLAEATKIKSEQVKPSSRQSMTTRRFFVMQRILTNKFPVKKG